jgi:hypothetical protein
LDRSRRKTVQLGSVRRFLVFWRVAFSEIPIRSSSVRNHTSETWG